MELIEKALRRTPFGLITDVDGTISKTAPTPQEAEVSSLCRQYLSILCNRLALVAAVSGRPAIQLRTMLKIDKMIYIGNHGLERWIKGHTKLTRGLKKYSKTVESALEELAPLLCMKGIRIENKGITATIHYRLCPKPEAAKRDILVALENSTPAKSLRILPGRMAINLLPPVEVNKGTAVSELIHEYNLQGGIYLGDDLTDIDAFRAMHAASRDLDFQGFAIGIISQEMPEKLAKEVDFTLNGVNDVERVLQWLSQRDYLNTLC